MTKYYTYDETTKTLSEASRVIPVVRRGKTYRVANAIAREYAALTPPAFPLADPMPSPPTPEAGFRVVFDGYALDVPTQSWVKAYRQEAIPMPTLNQYDDAMEEHLKREREDRGYTTREPDAYINSEVPRWKQDAEDWVRHRDQVMEYALTLINGVQAGKVSQPTLDEFVSGLPCIEWTYDDALDSQDEPVVEEGVEVVE